MSEATATEPKSAHRTECATWSYGPGGRQLVTVRVGAKEAQVHPVECDANTLRALADACMEAAEMLEANAT